jgi:hypothetical protein
MPAGTERCGPAIWVAISDPAGPLIERVLASEPSQCDHAEGVKATVVRLRRVNAFRRSESLGLVPDPGKSGISDAW